MNLENTNSPVVCSCSVTISSGARGPLHVDSSKCPIHGVKTVTIPVVELRSMPGAK